MNLNRSWFGRSAAVLALSGVLGLQTMAGAQTTHHSFLHRHRTAATLATGAGAYELARHRHHGFMHRHPFVTGAVAAGVMHHYAKHHH